MLSHLGDTWVITRTKNRSAIEHVLESAGPVPNLHFVYVDLPPAVRRWRRGQRGVRLYYLLWQREALREARRLGHERPFDLAWHLTFANAWIGSLACRLGVPFVYGPVGGGVATPWRLASTLGARGVLYELARTSARALGRYLNPLARASWRRAALILVQNEETKHWLPHRYQTRAEVFPNVVLERLPPEPPDSQHQVMLFAGRLLPWKGVSIALAALEQLPQWRLIICGDGPDLGRLQRQTTSRGLADRVEFRGWVPRDEVLRTMCEESSVLVFPSLHDEAGWAVAEAMAASLPVVCLDLGGPPAISGAENVVNSSSRQATVNQVAEQIVEATRVDRIQIRQSASEFLFEHRLESLRQLLRVHERRGAVEQVGPSVD
jgi:glycosyltransferase involved in cell wall biosynthesis